MDTSSLPGDWTVTYSDSGDNSITIPSHSSGNVGSYSLAYTAKMGTAVSPRSLTLSFEYAESSQALYDHCSLLYNTEIPYTSEGSSEPCDLNGFSNYSLEPLIHTNSPHDRTVDQYLGFGLETSVKIRDVLFLSRAGCC